MINHKVIDDDGVLVLSDRRDVDDDRLPVLIDRQHIDDARTDEDHHRMLAMAHLLPDMHYVNREIENIAGEKEEVG